MSDKIRNLLVRTLSGAVLTVVVVGAVLWSQWSFGVLLLAILIGGLVAGAAGGFFRGSGLRLRGGYFGIRKLGVGGVNKRFAHKIFFI